MMIDCAGGIYNKEQAKEVNMMRDLPTSFYPSLYQLIFIPHFISDLLIFVAYLQEARKAKFSLSQNDLWEAGKHIGGKLSNTK